MSINYQQVRFAGASGTPEQLPASTKPEVAFAGRSNVGKSSLMNRLFNRKGLVKVSSKPGKTTTINFFPTDTVDFVDLPGYGFAKVSAAERERWSRLMEGYFEQERQHALVICLVDIRHDVSPLDVQMVSYLAEHQLPMAIVLTKADKLSRSKQSQQLRRIAQGLKAPGDTPILTCSATSGQGIDDLRALIEEFTR
jgi:GTP-binding protein